MWKSYLLCCVVLSSLAFACAPQVRSADEKKAPATVRADDLCNGTCVIVGRLGKPYGEVSKVRAVWEVEKAPEKPKGPSLRITHIDGKKLDSDHQVVVEDLLYVKWCKKDREMSWDRIHDGQVVEGRVFESGGYLPSEYPLPVQEILGMPPVQSPYGFAFRSFLYFID
jgi:hypothetical protein